MATESHLFLLLDTASHDHIVAICSREKTLTLRMFEGRNDAAVIAAIETALSDARETYADLTHLACAVGPGGFTSLRIGVTAINTLAYALGVPSAGIHLSDLWSARVRLAPRSPAPLSSKMVLGEVGSPSHFLWLHSTRRTQLFVKGFGEDGTSTPAALMGIDEARALQGPYVGELIPEHREVLKNCHPVPEEQLLSLKNILPPLLMKLHYRKQRLVPWYGREG